MLQWWLELEDDVAPTPEEVTSTLLQLSLRGRYWANGFDGPVDDLDQLVERPHD